MFITFFVTLYKLIRLMNKGSKDYEYSTLDLVLFQKKKKKKKKAFDLIWEVLGFLDLPSLSI
jgi:hypothetical protein